MAIEAGIRLTAKNETAKAFQEFERNGRRSASKVAKEFETANRAMRNVGMALTGLALAGGALIVKATLLAARVETLGVVMNQVGKNAGYSTDEMADFEKGVRDMGITTQSARRGLIGLIGAEIDLEKATQLARLAQDAAVPAFINSSEAFDRIVYGIETLNPLVLKTMGLTLNLERAYGEYAKTMGVAVEEIDVATKKQIALNEVLEEGKTIAGSYEAAMDSSYKAMLSVARLSEEAQKALGEGFLPVMAFLVDMVSAAFKAFNSLNPEIQKMIGYSIAAGTALAGILGPMLILASQAPGFISSMSAVGNVFFSLGANINTVGVAAGSATRFLGNLAPALGALAVAAIAATAVIALALAIGMLVTFIVDLNDKRKTLIDLTKEHERELRKEGVSFQFYDKEMRRVIRDVGAFNLGSAKFNRLMREGGEEAVAAALDINFFGNETYTAMQKAEGAIDGWRTALDRATTVEGLAEGQLEGFADTADRLKQELDDLSFVMGVNVTEAFEDHSDRVGDLRDRQGELIDGIQELSGQKWLTDDQKQELSDMRVELGKVNEAVVAESEAWKKNTANIIFNMAQRALSQLTVGLEGPELQAALEVQAGALGALALELGLVDEAGSDAMTQILLLTGALGSGKLDGDKYIEMLLGLWSGLNRMDGTIVDIELRYRVTGLPSGGGGVLPFTPEEIAQGAGQLVTPGGGGVVGQRGLQGVVPPGYYQDNFRVGVSSGEEVIVRTREQQRTQVQSEPQGSRLEIGEVNINNTLDLRTFDTLMKEWAGL